jgi:mannosyltransferase
MSRSESLQKAKQSHPIFIVILMIAGLSLRLYRLNSGLWFDEILTLVKYVRLPFIQILTTYDSENQHMLYSLLAHLSWLIFGENPWALRLPAVLFGAASLWAVYEFGREVTDEIEAILAAGLLTFSYHHVWFSQNARGYTGLLFWSLISSWLLIRALDSNNRKTWFLYGITAALGIYTHITMLFMISGQVLCTLIHWMRRPNKAEFVNSSLGFLAAGLATLLLFSPVLADFPETITGEGQTAIATWQNPIWTIMQFMRGLQVSLGSGILIIGALLIFGWGLVSYFKKDLRVIVLFLAPAVIGALTVVALGHHLWPRFFFFTFGFAALIIIRGIFAAAGWVGKIFHLSKTVTFRLGLITCLSLIILSATSLVFVYGPKQDFLSAEKFVESSLKPGDQIVTVGLASFVYENYLGTGWRAVQSLQELDAIRSTASRTWLIYTLPTQLRGTSPEIMNDIERNFNVVHTFPGTLGDGTITVCLSK